MKPIDTIKLRQECRILWDLLERHATKERDAALCLRELKPIFMEVMNKEVTMPYKTIPCGWYFHEGALRQYSELEEAYSTFAFRAKGRDAEAAKAFLAEIDEEIAAKKK